jgi:hypothetical protein
MRPRGLVVLVMALVACGGDSDGGDDDPSGSGCMLDVALSGGVTVMIDSTDALDCQSATSNSGDPIFVWYPDDEEIMRVDITMDAEVLGMTGEHEGGFAVIDPDGYTWVGDCTFNITAWTGGGTSQVVDGTALCEPLEAETAAREDITAAQLTFRVR